MSAFNDLLERLRNEVASTVLAQKIWARYETAAPREQLAAKILGAFLAFVLALLLVVLPLHRFNSNAIADLRAQQDTLAWMQSNRGAIGAGTQKPRAAGDSLLTLANQGARNFGLSFKRYEPNGDGLNLWLEQVPFNQVVKRLDALQRDYGVIAIEFSASKRDEPGMVDVRVTLKG
jgi:general secretion pathway protein M